MPGPATTINGFNVGTDTRLAIQDQFGDVFTDSMLAHLMEFDSESEDTDLKITPITTGGVPIYQTIWNGVRGSLMFTRVNGSFQAMFLDIMNGYFNSGLISQFTMSQTVRNRDGSIDEYIYTGVQFSRPRFGRFQSVKEVDMRMDFRAGQVQAVGTLSSFLTGLANAA